MDGKHGLKNEFNLGNMSYQLNLIKWNPFVMYFKEHAFRIAVGITVLISLLVENTSNMGGIKIQVLVGLLIAGMVGTGAAATGLVANGILKAMLKTLWRMENLIWRQRGYT